MNTSNSLERWVTASVQEGAITDEKPLVMKMADLHGDLELTSNFATRLRDNGLVLTLHRDAPIVPDHIELNGIKDEAGTFLATPSRLQLLKEPELPMPLELIEYIKVRVAAATLGVPEKSNYDLFVELDGKKALGFGHPEVGMIRPDNMVMATCNKGTWTNAMAVPYSKLSFSPNMQALHYGSADFEGMTAEWDDEGNCNVFGIDMHFERINKGNIRLGLDPIPRDLFDKAIMTAIQQNARFIPQNGRLYIRPHCADIGTQMRVGNSGTTGFFVEVTPIGSAGSYFGTQEIKDGENVPMKVMGVPDNKVRAAEGQGNIKAAGGYAQTAPVIKAVRSLSITTEGVEEGISPDGVLYLDKFTDGSAGEWIGTPRICETNASNTIFFEDLGDGKYKLVVPSLGHGDILPGNTRGLVIDKATELGWEVVEKDVYFYEEIERKAFCAAVNCGTAAMLSPFDAMHMVHVVQDENGVRAELSGDLMEIRTQEEVNENPVPVPVQTLLKMLMDTKAGRSGDADRAKYLTTVPGIRLKASA